MSSSRQFAPTLVCMAVLVAAFLATGCQSVGPVTVSRDRLDYSNAVAESWKRQTLLNIVKLRYSDPPLFVDVGQIVGGYTLETAMSLGVEFDPSGRTDEIGGSGRFTDRPTITYVPMTGTDFIVGFLVPVTPATLLSSIKAGWPADIVLRIGASNINGYVNEEYFAGQFRPPDAEFLRIVELLRKLQVERLANFRIKRTADSTTASLVFSERSRESHPAAKELRRLIGLDDDATEAPVIVDDRRTSRGDMVVKTRSVLAILQVFSAHVVLPPSHTDSGRASVGAPDSLDVTADAFRILSSPEAPVDAFVAVNYRDTWFYIDDRDLASKRHLAILMLLFAVSGTNEDSTGPVLTIPTG